MSHDLIEVRDHLNQAIEAFDDIENKALSIQQEMNHMNSMARKGNTFVFQLQLVNVSMVHNVFMALKKVEQLIDTDPTVIELGSLARQVEQLEIKSIRQALSGGVSITDAAKTLEMGRTSLSEKIKKYRDRGVHI